MHTFIMVSEVPEGQVSKYKHVLPLTISGSVLAHSYMLSQFDTVDVTGEEAYTIEYTVQSNKHILPGPKLYASTRLKITYLGDELDIAIKDLTSCTRLSGYRVGLEWQEVACECGAKKLKSEIHSSWCPKHA